MRDTPVANAAARPGLPANRQCTATVIIRGHDIDIPGMSEQDREAMRAAPATAAFEQFGALFAGSLTGLESRCDVHARQAGDAIAVDVIPRDEGLRRVFTQLQLRFDTVPDVRIHSISFSNALGDRVDITMTDVQRNVSVPDSLFDAPAAG